MSGHSEVRGIVFFDVDGTLVPESSSQYLAGHLGHGEQLRAAEDAYAAGGLDNFAVSELDAAAWRGRRPVEVAGWLEELPLVDGIDEVVAECRRQHLLPVLATLAWNPVGASLCRRFGFLTSCGPMLEVVDGTYTGRVGAHLDEYGKRDFARATAAAYGVLLRNCAAIGDSRSDLPLFAEVGWRVAFNASAQVRTVADAVVDGNDLRAVLPALAKWREQSNAKAVSPANGRRSAEAVRRAGPASP